MNLKAVVAAIAFIGYTLMAAADPVEDNCAEVLRLAGRDETLASRHLIAAKYIYDKYCSGSQAKQGINLSIGVSEILDSFDLGFGSVDERIAQICKTYTEKGFTDEQALSRSSVVVRDAIGAWKQCKALSRKDIKVVPQVGDTSFNVDFVQGTGRPVTVNGVFYPSQAADCFARIGKNPATHVDKSTIATIQDGIPWTITCERKSQGAQSETVYPAFEFSVPTSGLTFRMDVPRSSLPSYSTVKQIAAQIDDLKRQLSSLPESLGLECQTLYQDTTSVSGPRTPRIAQCPAGYIVTGCTAGSDKGTIDNMTADQCIKLEAVEWVIARCCKIKQLRSTG